MVLNINYDNWFWLIVSILIVWRITYLICFDSGPFDIMLKIRKVLYRLRAGKLIECFHCTSIWISILVVLAIYEINASTVFLIIGIAGGASIIEKIIINETIIQESNNGNIQ